MTFWVCGFYVIIWAIHINIRKWDLSYVHLISYEIDKKYRSKIILKNNSYFEKTGTGRIQSIVQKGISAWTNALWEVLYFAPKAIFAIGSGFFVMYQFGFAYILVFVLLMILTSIIYVYFNNKRLEYRNKMNDIDNIHNGNSVRNIMSRVEIVMAGKVLEESERIRNFNLQKYKLDTVSAKFEFLADLAVSALTCLLPFLGTLIILYVNGFEKYSTLQLVTFVYFTTRLSNITWGMLWVIRQMMDKYPEMNGFWEFIDDVPEMKNYDEGKKFVHGGGGVVLENVGFKYDEKEEKSVLENFNLTITAGEKLALVGHSGSGKTTIAKLISGYMQPTSGTVKIDGQDLSELALKTYYKYLGYLTQEPMVFDGTIKENMLYALSDEDIKQSKKQKINLDEQIKQSLEKAQCDFVFGMKKGIETEIGEKGIRLSGGERQRLAIAKLFLKNPEIIILDEPTSALDSFSEDKISKALEELFKGRTTIIIAHRLQTVKKADRILVIENGKIVEEGTHTELIQRDGIYNDMLNMQSGF
jgi:ABC-type multidrug transport system fused ATPase/permease subunit